MKATILIPWASGDARRAPWLRAQLETLSRQADGLFSEGLDICLHVNGPDARRAASALLHHVPESVQVDMTYSSLGGKIAAVRSGARFALERSSHVLIVVDNDISLPLGALQTLVKASRKSSMNAATAYKAPHAGHGSSEFQKRYSYAVQESFRHRLFPKRPTGSFYTIAPEVALSKLSAAVAEATMLSQVGAVSSGTIVTSPYARSFRSEVRRRTRHGLAAAENGHVRLHSQNAFLDEAALIGVPASVDRTRFVSSIDLWTRVHSAAHAATIEVAPARHA